MGALHFSREAFLLVSGLYHILVAGRFRPDDVLCRFDPAATVTLTDAQRVEVWRSADALRQEGRVITAEPLYRLVSYAVTDVSLVLRVGLTNYEEYIGTNGCHREWREQSGANAMSDALALSAATETADGMLAIERRSRKVAERAGFYHVKPSGHPQPPESFTQGVLTELEEELGVRREEVAELVCTGLVRDAVSYKPELTYVLRIRADAADVQSRWKADAWESDEISFIPASPDALADWLTRHVHDTVPAGHAALLLYGRERFGAAWYERVAVGLHDAPRGTLPNAHGSTGSP